LQRTINPTRTNRPRHIGFPLHDPKTTERHPKRSVTHQKDTSSNAPNNQPMKPRTNPDLTNQPPTHPLPKQQTHRAPPTYPFLAYTTFKERVPKRTRGPSRERLSSRRPLPCQRASRLVPRTPNVAAIR